MRVLLIIFIATAMLGCRPPAGKKKAAAKSKPKPTPARKSTMQTAVDGFTGRTAVKSGRKAQNQIREISAKKDEDLDEVLGQ